MNAREPTRIVILGGGFAGLYAALQFEKTLARDPDIEVNLVNRENFFLFTPMLHEVAASDLDMTHIVNPIRKFFRRVKFFEGESGIDRSPWQEGSWFLMGSSHHHHELHYDHLVLSLGSDY